MSNEAEQALQEMEAAEDEERELEEVGTAVLHINSLQQRTWGWRKGGTAACAACPQQLRLQQTAGTCLVPSLCNAGWTDR